MARAHSVRDVTVAITAYRNFQAPMQEKIRNELAAQANAGLAGLATAKNLIAIKKTFEPVIRKMKAADKLEDADIKPLWAALNVSVVPSKLPDFERGRLGYEKHCVPCHGLQGAGDGQFANKFPHGVRGLESLPQLSPYSAYAVMTVGAKALKMPSMKRLFPKDQDMWNVAFYTAALADGPKPTKADPKIWQGMNLMDLSYLTRQQMDARSKEQRAQLRWWGPLDRELSRRSKNK